MTTSEYIDTAERLARIEQMIEGFRAAKQRQLVQRAIEWWRKTEIRQQLAEFETRPERIH